MTTPDTNTRDTQRGLAALEFLKAVRDEQVTHALALLDADPAISSLSIRTACACGDVNTVEQMLASNPALATSTIPPDYTPPLIYAALCDIKRARGVSEETQARLVTLLLECGADPNSSVALPDRAGSIPALYFPCIAGNAPVARVLLAHGANPTDGESVYHAAQHDRRDVLELLLAYGADLSHGPSAYGNTPLHFLASHRASNPLAPTVVRGMAWLLEHGADPRVPLTAIGDGQHASQRGETPLHRAAANGYGGELLALLVAHGADVNVARDDGATPYTLAIRSGNITGAGWLANHGADPSRVTATDRLLCACLTCDVVAAQTIVSEHPAIIATLNDGDAGALLQAMADENLDAVQLMLSLGWPLTPQSEWGGTALHWAAWHAQPSLVRELLARGAPVNLRDTRYGSSPIAWAAHGSLYSGKGSDADYVAIVELLLDAGASKEASINRWQEPPESMARPAVVELLQSRGFITDSN